MASIIQIAPAGSLKNGQVVFALQFEGTSVWQYALCKIGSKVVAFGKHSTMTNWVVLSPSHFNDSGWLTDTTIKAYMIPLSAYALSAVESVGMSFPTDLTSEIGVYTDGKGGVSNAPVTTPTTADVVKSLLTGSSATGATDTTTGGTTNTEWYKKPILWVAVAVVAIGAFLYSKK